MKKLSLILIIVGIFTLNLYSQNWQEIVLPGGGFAHSIYMLDEDHIFLGTDYGGTSKFLKSSDGGTTWQQQDISWSSINSGMIHTGGIYFLNADTGFIAEYGIHKTIDGGITWTPVFYGGMDDSTIMEGVWFADNTTGYAIGQHQPYSSPGVVAVLPSVLVKTTDGGNTWTTLNTPNNGFFADFYFIDSKIGYVLDTGWVNSANHFKIYKTTDGGQTWDTTRFDNDIITRSIYFSDNQNGFISGNLSNGDGYIIKTNDAGASWTINQIPTGSYNFEDIYFFNELKGIGLSNNAVLNTNDGGLTWYTVTLPGISQTLRTDFFNCTGFVSTDQSKIFKNTSCGMNLSVDAGNDIHLYCNQSTTLQPIVDYNGVVDSLAYSWSPSTGLDDTTLLNPTVNIVTTTTYHITVSDGTSLESDSVTVYIDQLPAPEICMVTVDSVTGKNKIIWEKGPQLPIEGYYIYKESFVAGVYNLLDYVTYSNAGTYIDQSSNPQQQSDKYKIAILDSCGYTSDLSNYHKTLHLNVSQAVPQGYALTWEHYVGFPFDTYVIYRKHNNNPFDSLTSLAYNLGTYTYTDLNPPGGNIYYFIAAQKLIPCDTSLINAKMFGEPYSQSISNIEDNMFSDIHELSDYECIVMPNPGNGKLNIVIDHAGLSEIQISVIDIHGKKVWQEDYNNSSGRFSEQINLDLPKGIYHMSIETDKGIIHKKLVIQ